MTGKVRQTFGRQELKLQFRVMFIPLVGFFELLIFERMTCSWSKRSMPYRLIQAVWLFVFSFAPIGTRDESHGKGDDAVSRYRNRG